MGNGIHGVMGALPVSLDPDSSPPQFRAFVQAVSSAQPDSSHCMFQPKGHLT